MNTSGCGQRRAHLVHPGPALEEEAKPPRTREPAGLVGMATLRPSPGRRNVSQSLLPTSRRGGGSEVLFQTVPGPEGGF